MGLLSRVLHMRYIFVSGSSYNNRESILYMVLLNTMDTDSSSDDDSTSVSTDDDSDDSDDDSDDSFVQEVIISFVALMEVGIRHRSGS